MKRNLDKNSKGVEDLKTTVELAKRGDLEAFTTLVGNFQDMAVGYAYSYLRDFHRSEDVAQEAFCEAYYKLPQIQKPGAFACWFRKIVFKHCDRITRKNEIEIVPIDALGDMVPSKETLQNSDFLEALSRLSDKEREVINLFYIGKYSRKEVAEFLCTSTSTVDRLLQASKHKLKGFLQMTKKELNKNRPSASIKFTREVVKRIPLYLTKKQLVKQSQALLNDFIAQKASALRRFGVHHPFFKNCM